MNSIFVGNEFCLLQGFNILLRDISVTLLYRILSSVDARDAV